MVIITDFNEHKNLNIRIKIDRSSQKMADFFFVVPMQNLKMKVVGVKKGLYVKISKGNLVCKI